MTTTTLPRLATTIRPPRGRQTAGPVVLSILGGMAAIGIAALGLLVVPIAALVVFGPALLELL